MKKYVIILGMMLILLIIYFSSGSFTNGLPGMFKGSGDLLFEIGQFEYALEWYDAGLEFDSKFIPALVGKSFVLNKLERYDESILHLRSAINVNSFETQKLVIQKLEIDNIGFYEDDVIVVTKSLTNPFCLILPIMLCS